MTPQPLLSVGIPTFNRPDGLRRTIVCITDQTYQNLEIIISDNCSPGTEVAQIGKDFSENDKRIHFYRQPQNEGPIHNFKYVLEKATGEYFIWIADDDQIREKKYLQKLMNEIAKGYDFVSPNVLKVNSIKKTELKNKEVHFTSGLSVFRKHLLVMKKMFIGYQVVGGIYKTTLLKNYSGLFFNSSYNKLYPDEEPFFHFMLSRFRWSYVDDIYYIKDMDSSAITHRGFFESLMPNFWNFVASSGIISQARYTDSEKVRLIFWKFLRNLYIQYTMLGK